MSQPRKTARASVAPRRTHRKSRLGCANCKRRRIKCDEKKPSCTNCIRHSIRCDFASLSPSNASSVASPGYDLGPSAHSPLLVAPPSPQLGSPVCVSGLNLVELELFQNYINATCETLGGGPRMAAIWRTTIPQMGFTHHYLLQLALALSAFQLARQQPERAAYLRNLAGQYQDAAVQRVTALLPGMNRDNCDQLYVAAVLISSLSFASGPTPGEYLLISDKGASGWLVLNRGTRAILELQKEILFSGRLSVMFRIAARRLRTAFANGPLPTICEEARTFRSYLVGLAVTEPNINTYLEAFDRLLWTLKGTMDAQEIGEANDSSMFLFSWIYCLEENFILCLQQHQPLALVILSYFTVMVYHCRTSWFIEGWSEHIMTGIHRLIPEEYKPWIRWPSKQVGWVERLSDSV